MFQITYPNGTPGGTASLDQNGKLASGQIPTTPLSLTFKDAEVGDYLDIQIPFDADITSYSMLADAIGDATVNVAKVPYPDYPPGSGTDLVDLELIADDKNTDSLAESVTEGDVLRFTITALVDITQLSINLTLER